MTVNAPLYLGYELPEVRPPLGNAGLWYNKMVHTWPPSFRATVSREEKDWKRRWLQTMYGGRVGDPKAIDEAVQRMQALVAARGGQVVTLYTETRLISGLGLPHPVEVGLAWHHTLGVPYLPGSSLKGVARDWARQWLGEAEAAARICGPAPGSDDGAGCVIFFDGLPAEPLRLEIDVMTPHYGRYYTGGAEPPADWHAPNPIPFLTVAPGHPFLFAVAPCTPEAGEEASRAAAWLVEALTSVGAGAKTAAGYGRFRRRPASAAEGRG